MEGTVERLGNVHLERALDILHVAPAIDSREVFDRRMAIAQVQALLGIGIELTKLRQKEKRWKQGNP